MYQEPLDQTIADLILPELEAELEAMGPFITVYIVSMIFGLLMGLASYVLQSVGTYTIAKRRGIQKPWLAWVPVGQSWVLGCISDQYQYVVHGKEKNKRRTLLILNIVMVVGYVALIAVYAGMIVWLLGMDASGELPNAEVMQMIGSLMGMMGAALVVGGAAIAVMVVTFIALYDLYKSCEPKNASMYLVLSIVIPIMFSLLSILQPLFVFLCRNKDAGMPPRKGAEPVPPAPEPVDVPFSPTGDYEWQPPAPERDPWDNISEES